MFRICTFIDLNHDCIILRWASHTFRCVKTPKVACLLDAEPIKTAEFLFPADLEDYKHADFAGVCLFACTQSKNCVNHKSVSPPKDLLHIHPHSPWMLKQLFACQPFGFRGTKNGAGNDHLHLCQPVKPNPRRQNERCQDLTCQSVSGTHLPTCPSTAPQGAILLLLALIDEQGRGVAPFPFPEYLKIDPVPLVSFLAAASLSLSWHIVGELQKAAICPGSCNPNLKYKRDMIPLNLEQIPLSLQISVTRRWKVWTWVSNAKFCALRSLGGALYFVHLSSTAVAHCTTLWMFQAA